MRIVIDCPCCSPRECECVPERPNIRLAQLNERYNMPRFLATFSPASGRPGVSERQFHVFDSQNTDGSANETVHLLDAERNEFEFDLDLTAGVKGSCYLIDVNSVGESKPSPSVVIESKPSEPPPPVDDVPQTPTVLSVVDITNGRPASNGSRGKNVISHHRR